MLGAGHPTICPRVVRAAALHMHEPLRQGHRAGHQGGCPAGTGSAGPLCPSVPFRGAPTAPAPPTHSITGSRAAEPRFPLDFPASGPGPAGFRPGSRGSANTRVTATLLPQPPGAECGGNSQMLQRGAAEVPTDTPSLKTQASPRPVREPENVSFNIVYAAVLKLPFINYYTIVI